MNLSFPTLLSILFLGLGIILIISAIQPFTTQLGMVVTAVGIIGIIIGVIRKR